MLWLGATFGCSALGGLGQFAQREGILSNPQNFNLVCFGCFAAVVKEPKPRLNMRDKRPANRESLAQTRKLRNGQQTLFLSLHESGLKAGLDSRGVQSCFSCLFSYKSSIMYSVSFYLKPNTHTKVSCELKMFSIGLIVALIFELISASEREHVYALVSV